MDFESLNYMRIGNREESVSQAMVSEFKASVDYE